MISQRVLSCRAEEGVSPCALTTPAAALPKRGGGGFVRSLGERMCSVPAEAGPRGRRLISGHMRSLGLRRRGKQTRSVTENSVETLMRASGPLARSYLGIAAVARGPHPDPQTRRGGVM